MSVATDDFAGLAAGADLSTRAPWSKHGSEGGSLVGATGGGAVSSANTGDSADGVYRYEAGSWGADQWCEVTYVATTGGAFKGPAIRLSPTGSGYGVIINGGGQPYLNLYLDGAFNGTSLVAGSPTIASGSVVRLQAIGSTIKLFDDGVEIYSGTNAVHKEGHPGLAVFTSNGAGDTKIDNWSAAGPVLRSGAVAGAGPMGAGPIGLHTHALTVVDAVAAGATLTPSASLIAGTATAAVDATASGVTLALGAGLAAVGAASGDAAAAGVTLTPSAALLANGAGGGAGGVTLAPTAALLPGTATGQANVTAAGATPSATVSLLAGAASGDGAAAGVTLGAAASLLAGSATGQAEAPGALLEVQAQLLAGTPAGSASAAGATLDLEASLVAGSAYVAQDATAPGVLLQIGSPALTPQEQAWLLQLVGLEGTLVDASVITGLLAWLQAGGFATLRDALRALNPSAPPESFMSGRFVVTGTEPLPLNQIDQADLGELIEMLDLLEIA